MNGAGVRVCGACATTRVGAGSPSRPRSLRSRAPSDHARYTISSGGVAGGPVTEGKIYGYSSQSSEITRLHRDHFDETLSSNCQTTGSGSHVLNKPNLMGTTWSGGKAVSTDKALED